MKINFVMLIFKWFIPVVCEKYNKEYQRYQVVSSNTALLFVDVEQTDYMFRPLSIRQSSGLARGTTEEELTMLPSTYNAHCHKATGKNEISFVATNEISFLPVAL